MKKFRLVSFILITILAYVFNAYYLEIPYFMFTGVLLGAWLFIGFVGLYAGKIYKKKRGLPQEEYAYALPDIMAKIMKKVDMRTQYESSILSMFFIMIGLIAFTIYIVFLTDFSWWFKGLTSFNSFWGFVFMFSYLITNYQQYVNYMETTKQMETLLKAAPQGSREFLPLNVPVNEVSLPPPNLDNADLDKMKGGTN